MENYSVQDELVRLFCFTCVAVAFLILFPTGSLSGSEVPDYLIQAVRDGGEDIQSGIGQVIIRTTFTDYGRSFLERLDQISGSHEARGKKILDLSNQTREIFIAFEGKKIRWDEKYIVEELKRIEEIRNAFDGEKGMMMTLGRPEGKIPVPWGQILSEHSPSHRLDPRHWGGTAVMGKDLYDLLRGFPSTGARKVDASLLGTERNDDAECYVIELNFENSVWKLWINPEISYRPSKVISRYQPHPLCKDTELGNIDHLFLNNTRYKRYENGVWFPQETVIQFYTVDRSTGEQQLVREEIRTVDDNFKLNVDVPDNLFMIDFPKGLEVMDMRTGKTFIAK